MPLEKPGGKLQATWLQTTVDDKPRLMLGNAQNYMIGSVYDEGTEAALLDEQEMVPAGPEDMFDEGNSMELSPIKLFRQRDATGSQEDSTDSGISGHWNVSGDVDDTFHFRRQTAISS